ncbi:MAG: 23S rRNA (adenine(2503)-C(2))-methyltransferase RlmN [Bacteroidales bacterium]|nr:23S rRNA (adenine(2503)-C(2))-methyltransferase RlmN [Bacteroidales bacterium]
MEKECVRNLNFDKLVEFCKKNNQQEFRARQISYWLWHKGVSDFESMTDLPKKFRGALEEAFYFDNIKIESTNRSKDKTTKILFSSLDNKLFEGVLIPSKDRVTACISTQSGCPLNCSFCSTGKMGFIRNLRVGEIFGQVFELNETCKKLFGRFLTNIVIMGMGEPLLNYENTLEAIKHITNENDLGFSPHRITLSTAGIAPKIKSLADDKKKFNLSISLHSADNQKRSEIMPINKKYDLETLSAAIRYFYEKTGQRITYEYILLKGINDDIKDAEKLSQFTKISPCKINLIGYNSGDSDIYLPSDGKKTEEFMTFLKSKNLIVTLRKSKGQDINAACGQLANKKQ